MFVRLFVDENLDRHVPISKQPKEKIQAIMDSCTRQFPEYAERARKRIRTYLKSCRRTKRSREQAGLDINNVRWRPASSRYLDVRIYQMEAKSKSLSDVSPIQRPTPPHLTSVLAEQLLARACENEAENAKRMRMGLEPVSQVQYSTVQCSLIQYGVSGRPRPALAADHGVALQLRHPRHGGHGRARPPAPAQPEPGGAARAAGLQAGAAGQPAVSRAAGGGAASRVQPSTRHTAGINTSDR